MQYLCMLGRQPALGLAELESKFGADSIVKIATNIAILTSAAVPDFSTLGGTVKAAKLLTELASIDFEVVSDHLRRALPDHLVYFPEGKITLGISTYGFDIRPAVINATALSLKKIIKKNGRSARVVPNNSADLNSAQVIHNKLTSENGIELIVVRAENKTLLGRTVWVQDIESYRLRDQERPARDARVGMLPPKLAQIIINLATGKIATDNIVILDPFCGTGVLIQEALLQGYSALGTDIEKKMVEYSQQNLEWLCETRSLSTARFELSVADATRHTWITKFDVVACETFLGRPLSSPPDNNILTKIIGDVNTIHKKFLINLAQQTNSGFRACIAMPAWSTTKGLTHLPVLDHLEELGYNRVSFKNVSSSDLVYRREGQIVSRELVVISRK